MADDELLEALAVDLTIDPRALVSRPGVRTTCARCGEEIINERELLVGDEVGCRG